ncbi:MAG TPA: hypothetical protein VIN71_02955, partial [Pseudomonadales bacterium]
ATDYIDFFVNGKRRLHYKLAVGSRQSSVSLIFIVWLSPPAITNPPLAMLAAPFAKGACGLCG